MTKVQDKQMKTIFRTVFPKFQSQTCKTPCTETVFETQLLGKSPSLDPLLKLVFDPVVSVTRSSFSISPQTLVGRLGGSISSGQTFLWVLLTLLTGD